MRIVGGEFRGRRLVAPKGDIARPTTDRLRERLFNILEHSGHCELDGSRVADVFAGTGALGLEALSRGAAIAVFVEKHHASTKALRENIAALGVDGRSVVLSADARSLPRQDAFDIIFMDPPYGKGLAAPVLEGFRKSGWIVGGTLVVLETGKGEALIAEGYEEVDERTQGDSRLLFLKAVG